MGDLTTAIIGGGVAGLALARGLLRRHGARALRPGGVRIYERHRDNHVQGFGFLVQSEGCRALRRLGLDAEAPELGLALRQVQIFLRDGRLIAQHPLEDTVAMERPALLRALARDLPPQLLRFNQAVEAFSLESGRVRGLLLSDGERIPVDLVIGADGARSSCRALLESGPRLPGRLARVQEIVACVDHPAMARELGAGFIKLIHPDGGLAVGLVPLPAGRVIWFVQFDSQRHPLQPGNDLRSFAVQLLKGFPSWLHTFLLDTDPTRPHHWRPLDLDPPTHLVGPNLALIGDAAHPMLPFTSQGVNLALADAALLAAVLPVQGDPARLSRALQRYQRWRQPLRPPFVAMGRAMAADFLTSGHQAAARPPVAT